MANLFKKAKETGPSAKPTKQKTEVVIKDKAFHATMHRLAEVNRQKDELEAEATILTGEVKERSISEFVKLYNTTDKFPGSFNVIATGAVGKENSSLMIIPTDRYLKVDEDRYIELIEKYGVGTITEETTVYTMDAKLIEKYGEIISNLIENCKKIDEEDKEALIAATTSYSIKKGTINDIPSLIKELAKKKKKATVTSMIEEIRPVYQIKNVKNDVIKPEVKK